jgi:hypothetical protein
MFQEVPTRRCGAVDDEEWETGGNPEFLTGHESLKTARIFTAPPIARHVFPKVGDSDADVHNVGIPKPVCKKRIRRTPIDAFVKSKTKVPNA